MIWKFTIRGRLVVQGLLLASLVRELTDGEKDYLNDVLTTLGVAYGTLGIWAPEFKFGMIGRLATKAVVNPVTIGTLPYTLSLVTSEILEKTGVITKQQADNYQGFVTGGLIGESDINYWDTDPYGSGYFNVGKNVETIMLHYFGDEIMDLQEGSQDWIPGPAPFRPPFGNPLITY